LDSGANIASSSIPPSSSPRSASSSTPVAYETPVIATCARENSGKRELLKETTTTALVFPNGGVIRLSAAVAPGQLLFLTNQKTKREVVTQVTRKRANPASGFYIELEFTEPAPGFWGIEFSENPAAVPASPQQPSAVEYELLHSDEPAPDDLSPSAPAPTAAEVQALVDEVEVLRAQLRSMQTQSAAPPAEHPAADAPVPSSTPAPPLAAMLTASLNKPAAPQKSETSPDHGASSASTILEPPPSEEKQLNPELEEDLLPKPALDFQKAKTPKQIPPPIQPVAASADRSGLLRLALLAVVSLFAVTVAAWNMHWLPWLTGPSAPFGTWSSAGRSAATPSVKPPQASQQKPNAHLDPKALTQATSNSPSQANPVGVDATQPADASAAIPSDLQEQPAESADAASKPVVEKDSVPLVLASKRSPVHTAPLADARPSDDTTAIVPPRLLKSVKPIAPSDALRSFVTGNVVLDALVDKSGHVESMKVLSGPPSFHKAAMDALKQYRYEPARQHGKPVPAHVTVTVPFLFEP
jgi:TonB family protein